MSAKVSAQKARLSMREKTKMPAARQSTPDSEALASSDDDVDRLGHGPVAGRPPVRRSSWLNDIRPPRTSGAGSGSQPTTPSAEVDSWLPSHTNLWQRPGDANSRAIDESPIASPTSYTDSSLPFEFPLQPTRKTFRSASYSVGQLGDEHEDQDNPQTSAAVPQPYRSAGTKLYHRPSRPSQLNSSFGLSRLREDDDGLEEEDITTTASRNGLPPETSSSRLLKQAATEHARLRQRSFPAPQIESPEPPMDASRISSSSAERSEDNGHQDLNGGNLSNSVTSPWDRSSFVGPHSQMNPHPLRSGPHSSFTSDDLLTEGPRRAQWQSQLGFGNIGEGHQSRRHSFADVSLRTRTGSMHNNMWPDALEEEYTDLYPTTSRHSDQHEAAAAQQLNDSRTLDSRDPFYFSGMGSLLRQHATTTGASAPSLPASMNPYEVPHSIGRTTKHFYLVEFKCARAEIYFIPGSTGLNVQEGDMVIVDGDRGWDLGAVKFADISLEEARKLRENAAREHYNLLMLFSQNSPQSNAGAGPNGPLRSLPEYLRITNNARPRVPGVDGEQEVKMRMIKRLASPHEIHALRDKEGSEAKAKRICHAKVVEHGLPMEVLDAEYQADWKKLTFFYYATHYVNFNDLVQDLFKIFKTRIWMATINPAAAPQAGETIQGRVGMAPGAVGGGRSRGNGSVWGPYSPLQGTGGYNQWGEALPPHPDEGYGGPSWHQPPPLDPAVMQQAWLPPSMTPRQPSITPHMLSTRDEFRQMPAMFDVPGGPSGSGPVSQAPPDVHRIPPFTPNLMSAGNGGFPQPSSNVQRVTQFSPHVMPPNHHQQTPASFEAGLQALSLQDPSDTNRRIED